MRATHFAHRKIGGFSLVEIAIALGIVAFALAGIVGLLSATLKTARSSMDDLLISEMTSDIINTLRKQEFTNISANAADIFYDGSGKRINGVNTTTGVISNMATELAISQGAIYSCAPSVVSDATLEATTNSVVVPNLLKITLAFKWPAGATNSANSKTLHAEIARY